MTVRSIVSLMGELGETLRGQGLRKIVREMFDDVARSNQWIWMRRNNVSWGAVGGSTKQVT